MITVIAHVITERRSCYQRIVGCDCLTISECTVCGWWTTGPPKLVAAAVAAHVGTVVS